MRYHANVQTPRKRKAFTTNERGLSMTENKTPAINCVDYNEFLNITLKEAFEEHKLHFIDLYNMQSTGIRNYLWMNVVITSALCSILAFADLNIHELDGLRPIFGPGICIATALSIYTFIKAALTYRGLGMASVTEFYYQKINQAYWEGNLETKAAWIAELDSIIQDARGYSCVVAEKIHELNTATVTAASIGAISTLLFFLDNFMR